MRSIILSLTVGAGLLVSCSSAPIPTPSHAPPGPASATPDVANLAQLEARAVRVPAFGAALACPTTPGEPANAFSPFGTGFTPGNGPVYPDLGDRVIAAAVPSKVLWLASPNYRGPILIRGKQIDGPGVVKFGATSTAQPSLTLNSTGTAVATGTGWRSWPSYTFVDAPGCYAYQVDGETFSETIIFRASLGPSGQPGCLPPSPGSNEVEGTSSNAELWALLFVPAQSIHAGDPVKIVWRMTGSGTFRVAATGPAGTPAHLTFGPDGHPGSNWTRPGEEWGTGFIFPTAGCWDLHATRNAAAGDVWLLVR